MGLSVKFWGVRGSIACASPNHMKYGGNTSCIEARVGEQRIVLDAGTGVRNLGQDIQQGGCRELHLLLTHTHWDHINGFPFFMPAYDATKSVHIMAGHLIDAGGIQQVLSTQMHNPVFPVPIQAMKASIRYEDFRAGEKITLTDGVVVKTAPLNHPNGATAYRIEHAGKSFVYVTDTEHVPGNPDQTILALIEGADLVIYDSTYTEQEFPAKVGWGHSTWNEGMRLCRMANVKSFAIFHHDPDHFDDFMDQVAAEARKEWSDAFVCREGMVVDLG